MSVPRALRLPLLVLAGAQGVVCVAAGLWLVATDGAGVPEEWAGDLPFTRWLVPGLLLAVVIGGTQLLALALDLRRHRLALAAHATAGLTMMIWTYVEVAVLPVYSGLHTLFLALGTAQVVLVLLALGVLPRVRDGR